MILGFCTLAVKLFGPIQLYPVAAVFVLAGNKSVCPSQIVELFEAFGAGGVGLIVTVVIPNGPGHPATVTNTEYTPAVNVVVLAIVGF